METIKVGIEDMALYVPHLYLDIEELAEARNLEYAKLRYGLGLSKMAVPDFHEDPATMAANAVLELLERNQIHPSKIGRIYIGTESAFDGSKPMATYVLGMLESTLVEKYGPNSMKHCDVVDMTFACIGAVDAMQNTIDWAAGHPERIGIVVATDHAKYELESTGEYTQGAGAVALLIKQNPAMVAFGPHWGVSTESVHDFFKPLRQQNKLQLVEEVLNASEANTEPGNTILERLAQKQGSPLAEATPTMLVHSPMPVFDGPYSNQCYQDRVVEAYEHFRTQKQISSQPLVEEWEGLIFHLPYAYHAKRMCIELFWNAQKANGNHQEIEAATGLIEPDPKDFSDKGLYRKTLGGFLRAVGKTETYKTFNKQKLDPAAQASSEIGNMYTCSIFTALMSFMEQALHNERKLEDSKLGFFAYGSGAKSKVFEGEVQAGWKAVASKFNLSGRLGSRKRISYSDYESLHHENRSGSVNGVEPGFFLEKMGTEGNLLGARYYGYKG